MQDVVLDACCAINLYAAWVILSGDPPRPSRARRKTGTRGSPPAKPWLDYQLHLPAKVREEAKYILQPENEDSDKLVKTAIELEPLVRAGVLDECDLEGEAENDLFVQMAVRLDDGEAACFAIAKNRGWLLATDERLTERFAQQHGVSIITTPELVKHWADKSKASDETIARILSNIQTYAHYFPRKALPLHAWWMTLVKRFRTP